MNRSQLCRVVAAVGIFALGIAVPALADGPPPTVQTVDQSNFSPTPAPFAAPGSWALAPDGDPSVPSGTAELVAGPKAPPAGAGSLRLYNTDAGQLTTVNNTGLSGTPVSSITGATYSTYVDEDSQTGPSQISLKFGVPGGSIVFDPVYPYNADAYVHGVWHTWDAANAPSGWWATSGANLASCNDQGSCSFTQIKDALATAGVTTINDVKLAVGRGPSNFDGNVDRLDLTINGATTRYDFESDAVNNHTVTRVDESNTAGWTSEGSNGTDSNGGFAVSYVAGPNLPGLSGAGSVSLHHNGTSSYSALIQDYLAGRGDATQTYLGSLDNISLQSYRLGDSTKGDYPEVRFEVRLPDPQTQFAFTSIVSNPAGETTGNIDKLTDIHANGSTLDTRNWYLTHDIAGLQSGPNHTYTWAEIMHSDLRDAVITKALLAAGSSSGTGVFDGGVDLLRFDYRDGSSQTWDFEKAGVYAPYSGPLPDYVDVPNNRFTGTPTVDADGNFSGLAFTVETDRYNHNLNGTPNDTSDDYYGVYNATTNHFDPNEVTLVAGRNVQIYYFLDDHLFGLTDQRSSGFLCEGVTNALGVVDCGPAVGGEDLLEAWTTNDVYVGAFGDGIAVGSIVQKAPITAAGTVTHVQNKVAGLGS